MADHYDPTEIAIVGMSGRFPGAGNVDRFWQNLCDGVESLRLLTEQELKSFELISDLPRDPNYVNAVGRLDDFDCFDASFFGYTPREAEIMDPQHRLLLECAWEALENAGYDTEHYPRPVGVFAGATINTYLLLNISTNPELVRSIDDVQINTANGSDFLTTRISYKLNLKGPSHTIQCACSTSLAAAHIASQSLLNEECDMALAGGVSINVKLLNGYRYLPGGITSPDGHCRAFDEKAEGTVFASGVGVVVLKRMADAIADRDFIHAVIKGSALNNDGALKVGYTAPGVEGQAGVIAEALANAGVNAESITYVETHGTGTPLGDPVEIQALTKAFRATTDKKRFCAIGSVKSNIGHLDAAAGVASLIKTTLALNHQLIPPSLNFSRPNPKIDFDNSPFFVADRLTPWPARPSPRRAGVSSFGVGGTNAHLILEEAPPPPPPSARRPYLLLPISARTDAALQAATDNLTAHLRQHPELNMADVAYTLSVGRRAMAHRRVVVCSGLEDAVSALAGAEAHRVFTDVHQLDDRPVVFMFPGQGAQYVNAGSGLYRDEPVFRQEVDRCCKILESDLCFDLRELMYPGEERAQTAGRELNKTQFTQPALFVTEYALSKLFVAWGVTPQAMIGHSIGEYVAACLAEVFSLEDALSLVSSRGVLMQETACGVMAAVGLPEEEVRPLLGKHLSLAAINGPAQCVVSGPSYAVEEFEGRLGQMALVCRRLSTSHSFHSQAMDAIIERFVERVRQVSLNPPQTPYISNVTGTWMTPEDAQDPEYWAKQLRQTVRFDEGLRELLKETNRVLLEVGPGHTLSRIAKRHLNSSPDRPVLSSLRSQNDANSDSAVLLNMLGQLWLAGVKVDWSEFYSGERRRRVSLPTYPFERLQYWIDPKARTEAPAITSAGQLVKKPQIADWFYVPSWKRTLILKPEKDAASQIEKRRLLILMDEMGIGTALAELFLEEGHDVVTARTASEFGTTAEGAYTINPEARLDYGALVKALGEQATFPDEIIHLWSLTPDDHGSGGSEFFARAQLLGFSSLLLLSQAIGQENSTESIHIKVVSNNVCYLPGDQSFFPEKATILGPCKIIPQEYPNIECRFVDIVASESGALPRDRLIDQLSAELKSSSTDSITAYRASQRWVQTFEPVRIEIEAGKKPTLREHGAYLIAGGLAGLGYSLAEFLAKNVEPNLVLIEATKLPSGGDWARWLASHDGLDQISHKVSNAQRLEQLGAKVSIIHADVTDQRQLQAAVEQATEQFGRIHGAIYAEGEEGKTSFRTVREVNPAESVRQLQSTFCALRAFEQTLRANEPDFCILSSSLSSVLGGIGYVVQASASLFMDAFAISRNRDSNRLWMSVDWDAWRFDRGLEQLAAISEELTELALTPEEGMEAFKCILSVGSADQIIVSTGDLQSRFDRWVSSGLLRGSKPQHAEIVPKSGRDRPPLQNAYVAPGNEMERVIADIWRRALGIDQVGVCDNFFDLGGDSLIAIMVTAQLKAELNLEVAVVNLYEGLTIRSLVNLLSHDEAASSSEKSSGQVEQVKRKMTARKLYQEKQRSRRLTVAGEDNT